MKRNANLDVLRAGAILMVVAHHLNQMSPGAVGWTVRLTNHGALGVDLFFVLSGWLVGGLYWRELDRNRGVDGLRFVLARAARTVPPYLAVLPVAWLGTAVVRGEPFDFGYLVFVQNYYEQLPFFFVSWSLCVEEHFYLALPLVLFVIRRSRALVHWTLLAGVCLPTLMRIQAEVQDAAAHFGFLTTATHLRSEGLVLGVWLSFVACREPRLYSGLVVLARWLAVPLIVLALALSSAPFEVYYGFGGLAVAVAFGALLVAVVDLRWAAPAAVERSIYWVSISSYSCYLTHSMVLHVCGWIAARWTGLERLGYFALAPLGILLTAGALHVLVERPVLKWRSRRFPSPRRDVISSPALALPIAAGGERS